MYAFQPLAAITYPSDTLLLVDGWPVASEREAGSYEERHEIGWVPTALGGSGGEHHRRDAAANPFDDGSPRQVTLGDLGSDSKFSISLAPGATRVFQTAGSGSDSSGAAMVSSDQVVNVWGVHSAFDGSGSLRRETGLAAAGTSTAFRIPVDAAAGVALYNPGALRGQSLLC